MSHQDFQEAPPKNRQKKDLACSFQHQYVTKHCYWSYQQTSCCHQACLSIALMQLFHSIQLRWNEHWTLWFPPTYMMQPLAFNFFLLFVFLSSLNFQLVQSVEPLYFFPFSSVFQLSQVCLMLVFLYSKTGKEWCKRGGDSVKWADRDSACLRVPEHWKIRYFKVKGEHRIKIESHIFRWQLQILQPGLTSGIKKHLEISQLSQY